MKFATKKLIALLLSHPVGRRVKNGYFLHEIQAPSTFDRVEIDVLCTECFLQLPHSLLRKNLDEAKSFLPNFMI